MKYYTLKNDLWFSGPNKKQKLDWDTRVRIALGAAEGLAYLHHDCCPRIIHRDVKSSNILLDNDFEAHLTDFGIAKSLCPSKSHTSTYIMGTIGYIDPEYARTSRLTEKSDVYSYGIVLLELLTGRKAVDNESNLHYLVCFKFHLYFLAQELLEGSLDYYTDNLTHPTSSSVLIIILRMLPSNMFIFSSMADHDEGSKKCSNGDG